ncbi:hypothetical protein GPJ56_010840 [Histomonas meleagridis]|uniref:uncharacterized protein n=1 Tax=Histomonas meleagridis TaxID=135588 RepID=UPI00355A8E1E|nr:hypothetical protein GPJ56_010840 [Histomonas meleagridis]KAH0803738.1 hypothetical protein GO595_003512 [Histomonas meleagridis]
MGKNHRKEKRIRQVGESALKSEILRNQEKVPEILPDSALFAESIEKPKKKKKIILHPRPEPQPKLKPAEEYYDIWASAPTKSTKPQKKNTKKEYSVPSSMSYRSKELVNPEIEKIRKQQEEEANGIQSTITNIQYIGDSGIGDTLEGDVSNGPLIDIPAPNPPQRKPKRLLNMPVPKYLPDEQKAKIKREIRENFKLLRQEKEEELVPEFERTKETAEEINKRMEELANRPKKEKEHVDGILNFIADEPSLEMEKLPQNLSEVQADQRPLARLQRSFEIRRKVALHE